MVSPRVSVVCNGGHEHIANLVFCCNISGCFNSLKTLNGIETTWPKCPTAKLLDWIMLIYFGYVKRSIGAYPVLFETSFLACKKSLEHPKNKVDIFHLALVTVNMIYMIFVMLHF